MVGGLERRGGPGWIPSEGSGQDEEVRREA